MTNNIETIRRYHTTRTIGSRVKLIARSEWLNQAYQDISEAEIAELVQLSLGDDDLQCVLASSKKCRMFARKKKHRRCGVPTIRWASSGRRKRAKPLQL